MTPLPVSMIPIVGGAAKAGGLVVAVLVGLAIYVAAKKAGSLGTQQPPR